MGEAMAADSNYKKKLNKQREPTIRMKRPKHLRLCNTQVYAPAFLSLGLRYEKVFLQLDLNKN